MHDKSCSVPEIESQTFEWMKANDLAGYDWWTHELPTDNPCILLTKNVRRIEEWSELHGWDKKATDSIKSWKPEYMAEWVRAFDELNLNFQKNFPDSHTVFGGKEEWTKFANRYINPLEKICIKILNTAKRFK